MEKLSDILVCPISQIKILKSVKVKDVPLIARTSLVYHDLRIGEKDFFKLHKFWLWELFYRKFIRFC